MAKKRYQDFRLPKGSRPRTTAIGVAGMGLTGTSIATCLLASGHPVKGVARRAERREEARALLVKHIREMRKEGFTHRTVRELMPHFEISGDYHILADCQVVVESIAENVKAKREVIGKIENAVSPKTIIGSNTSGIPISLLQDGMKHPERIMGTHWGEPAHILRFMEVICGKKTRLAYAQRVKAMAEEWWGKEPGLLRKDIRGFIANRCMYALFREALYLVDSGVCTMEDVDRSVRNDFGYWSTFVGPFRLMDIQGLHAFAAVMKDLLPDLNCRKTIPPSLKKLVDAGARGIANAKGFYPYTKASARAWEKRFNEFSYEALAAALRFQKKHKLH